MKFHFKELKMNSIFKKKYFLVLAVILKVSIQFDESKYSCEPKNTWSPSGDLEISDGCTIYSSTQFSDYSNLAFIKTTNTTNEAECCMKCKSLNCDFFLFFKNENLVQCNFYSALNSSLLYLCTNPLLYIGMPAIS